VKTAPKNRKPKAAVAAKTASGSKQTTPPTLSTPAATPLKPRVGPKSYALLFAFLIVLVGVVGGLVALGRRKPAPVAQEATVTPPADPPV
jgi:hypothetical protein